MEWGGRPRKQYIVNVFVLSCLFFNCLVTDQEVGKKVEMLGQGEADGKIFFFFNLFKSTKNEAILSVGL